MSGPFIFSRRRFLQYDRRILRAVARRQHGQARARQRRGAARGYKALVCVFMFGGNDASNMVMPLTNYAQYLASRPVSTGINIPQASLLPITPANTGGRAVRAAPGDAGAAEPVRASASARSCATSARCPSRSRGRSTSRPSTAASRFRTTSSRTATSSSSSCRRSATRRSRRSPAGAAASPTRSSGSTRRRRRRCRCRSPARRRSATASPSARCRCPPAATSASPATAGARRRSRAAAARSSLLTLPDSNQIVGAAQQTMQTRAQLERAPEPDPAGRGLVGDHDGVHRRHLGSREPAEGRGEGDRAARDARAPARDLLRLDRRVRHAHGRDRRATTTCSRRCRRRSTRSTWRRPAWVSRTR